MITVSPTGVSLRGSRGRVCPTTSTRSRAGPSRKSRGRVCVLRTCQVTDAGNSCKQQRKPTYAKTLRRSAREAATLQPYPPAIPSSHTLQPWIHPSIRPASQPPCPPASPPATPACRAEVIREVSRRSASGPERLLAAAGWAGCAGPRRLGPVPSVARHSAWRRVRLGA